jgi:hypothetical protein
MPHRLSSHETPAIRRVLVTLAFSAALGALSCTTAAAQQISLEPTTPAPAPAPIATTPDTGSSSGSARFLCETINLSDGKVC